MDIKGEAQDDMRKSIGVTGKVSPGARYGSGHKQGGQPPWETVLEE